MSKVFVDLGISIDGYIAGLNGGPKNPMGGEAFKLHKWVFPLKAFRQHLSLGDDGIDNDDNKLMEKVFARIGANIMGKRMFDEGEVSWPEKAPFGVPVYVFTHNLREPWVRPGGTTFFFVNDTIENILKKAKLEAGNKDVRISGGANIVQQYINAGLVDELTLHVAPLYMGSGVRLFENINKEKFTLEIKEAINSPSVTHITYKVINVK